MDEEKEVVNNPDEGHVIFIDRLVDFPIQKEKGKNASSEEDENS